MTKAEFATIANVLRTFYPKENLIPTEEALTLWHGFLKDLDYAAVSSAIQKWVATNKWSPSIAEIRAEVVKIEHGETPDWGEGYDQMRKAISKFGYMNEDQALDYLDGITKETVKRLGWMNICTSADEVTLRANFRMIYETLAKRKQTDDQTPPAVKERIRAISEKLAPGIEVKNG